MIRPGCWLCITPLGATMSDPVSAPDGAQAEARDEPAWLAEAIAAPLHYVNEYDPYNDTVDEQTNKAILAALPIIREQIAREIEAAADVRLNDDKPDEYGTAFWNGLEDGYEEAAQIVRGAS